MTSKRQAYVPSMSDATVRAKTGKDWAGWFAALDKAGARKRQHGAIADILAKRRVPGWWCQMVTVEYERARGLRARHETTRGFSVTISKTVATTLAQLYEATANPAKRRRWFPRGAFVPASQTKNKYLRGAWNETARLEISFYATGTGKVQIAVGVNKLAKPGDVEVQRAAWRTALDKLAAMVEP
jgi:hypothetical protein